MNGRERTLTAISHREPDRVPLNIWFFRDDAARPAVARYGSLDAFYDALGIDMFMAITPPPNRHNVDFLEERMAMAPEDITPADFLDPDDPAVYAGVAELLAKHRGERAVLAHVWGVVESLYSFCGVERTLALMAGDPDRTAALFDLMRAFSIRVARNLCAMGIDILHVTGDVGANRTMLFSPDMWRAQVAPFDAGIIAVGREAGLPVSLHTCGYFEPVLPDLIEMGVALVHPVQESAGMDQADVKRRYGDRLTIHGGLDVRLLPRMSLAEVEAVVRAKMATLKPGGGFIFNTSHTVQPDTPLELIERAYDVAREAGAYP